MFSTCWAEEWRARAVLATIYDDARNSIVVPSYLFSPVLWKSDSASDGIVDEDARFEYRRNIPCNVVYPALGFFWSLPFPAASIG